MSKHTGSSDDTMMRGYRSSATSLLFTILRLVGPGRDAPIWTGTLVRALELCGMQERNARQAIARIAERGNLRPEKVGARTRWHITERGQGQLDRAQKLASDAGTVQEDWDGQWLVVICPVPEEQREKRRLFRSYLVSHGCGFVGPGVAVCSHVEREGLISAVLREFELERSAIVFKAKAGEILNDRDLLERAWDLDDFARSYAEFIAEFEAKVAVSDEDRFAAFTALTHEWFHFSDPELPRSLLPSPWIGDRAKALFDQRSAEWRDAALRWFDEGNI